MPPPPLPDYPKLHPGCEMTLHTFREGPAWVLENPTTGKFFRFGLREEALIRQLDGQHSLIEILHQAQAKESAIAAPNASTDSGNEAADDALSPEDVFLLLQSLRHAGLLVEDSTTGSSAPTAARPPINPLFLKIRLGNPDRLLEDPTRWITKIPWAPVVWLYAALLVVAGFLVAQEFSSFLATLGGILSTANLPLLTVTFIVLKLIHEMAHGIACKAYGGHVPEVGVLLVVFLPLTYIDATSSWRSPSRGPRLMVSSAGILAEMGVAALAVLVWAQTEPGLWNMAAANTVVAASVTTLLFNANPLMRFDGYFILADLLGRPNLYTKATKEGHRLLSSVFLGIRQTTGSPLEWPLAFYGLACFVWRTLLVWGICIGVVAFLHGFGLILAAFTLFGTYLPVFRAFPRTLASWKQTPPSWWVVALWLVLLGALLFLPMASAPSALAVIEPAGKTVLRVHCPGFAVGVEAREGRLVRQGEMLFELENPEEAKRPATLENESQRATIQANLAREKGDTPLMAQYLQQAKALREQAQEAAAYLSSLQVVAPIDGMLFGRHPEQLLGRYLPTGSELITLGDAREREVRLVLPQRAFDRIRPRPGDSVQVFIPGRLRSYDGIIETVESSATQEIRLEALTALAGGPLEVQPVQNPSSTSSSSPAPSSQQRATYELIEPHFHLQVALDDPTEALLLPGETGRARFSQAPRQTLFSLSVDAVRRFIERSASAYLQ